MRHRVEGKRPGRRLPHSWQRPQLVSIQSNPEQRRVLCQGHSSELERFPLDVNRNSYRGVPSGTQIRFESSDGDDGGTRWRSVTRRTCGCERCRSSRGGESAREAARVLGLGASTAIRWIERWTRTGSVDALPGTGHSRSPLEQHRQWLLDLISAEPDLTLEEIRARLRSESKQASGTTSIWRFYDRHEITFKKNSSCRRAGSA